MICVTVSEGVIDVHVGIEIADRIIHYLRKGNCRVAIKARRKQDQIDDCVPIVWICRIGAPRVSKKLHTLRFQDNALALGSGQPALFTPRWASSVANILLGSALIDFGNGLLTIAGNLKSIAADVNGQQSPADGAVAADVIF
jgi:hypothetical protein